MVALIFIAILFKLSVTKSDQDFNLCYKTKAIKMFYHQERILFFLKTESYIYDVIMFLFNIMVR